jgi:hypothetical protein
MFSWKQNFCCAIIIFTFILKMIKAHYIMQHEHDRQRTYDVQPKGFRVTIVVGKK